MSAEQKQLYTFLTIINELKFIERFKGQVYWQEYDQPSRYESVADHSWRLSLMIMLLADKLSQPFDTLKAIKMALIHDLPEIIEGDVSPLGTDGTGKDSHAFNKTVWQSRHEREKAAARKIFSSLPAKQGDELLKLWLEMDTQASYEARIVKSLDRIEALLQVLQYRDGHVFPAHLDFTLKYGTKDADVDPAVAVFGQTVVDEFKLKYQPFEPKVSKS